VSFHYALQPALEAAEAREREALGALTRARRAAQAAAAALEHIAARERTLPVASRMRGPFVAIEAMVAEALRGLLARERETSLARLRRSDAAVARAQAKLAPAFARRSAFERHRANLRAAWALRAELREEAEFAEAAEHARTRARHFQASGALVRKDAG